MNRKITVSISLLIAIFYCDKLQAQNHSFTPDSSFVKRWFEGRLPNFNNQDFSIFTITESELKERLQDTTIVGLDIILKNPKMGKLYRNYARPVKNGSEENEFPFVIYGTTKYQTLPAEGYDYDAKLFYKKDFLHRITAYGFNVDFKNFNLKKHTETAVFFIPKYVLADTSNYRLNVTVDVMGGGISRYEGVTLQNIKSRIKPVQKSNKPSIAPKKDQLCEKIQILYGTDRKFSRDSKKGIIYGELQDNINETYKVGYTIVSIPPNHRPGKTERPSFWKFEFHEDTLKHIVQTKTVLMNNKDFNKLLSIKGEKTDAFIFVHGYNSTFEGAALKTAQLAKDIHLPIMPIMFSWSSNGNLKDYVSDRQNVDVAMPEFKDFLIRVAKNGNFHKLHLIGHSMGNLLIAKTISTMGNEKSTIKIDQLVMAAPDVDAAIFRRDYANMMTTISKRVTVYSAKNDWALKTSENIQKRIRLGEVGLPPFLVSHVDIIDAQRVKTDFLGHDRFSESEAIMNDIDKLFITGLGPYQRGVPSKMEGRYRYFYFGNWKHQ